MGKGILIRRVKYSLWVGLMGLLVSGGCFDIDYKIKINRDGSGIFTEEMRMGPDGKSEQSLQYDLEYDTTFWDTVSAPVIGLEKRFKSLEEIKEVKIEGDLLRKINLGAELLNRSLFSSLYLIKGGFYISQAKQKKEELSQMVTEDRLVTFIFELPGKVIKGYPITKVIESYPITIEVEPIIEGSKITWKIPYRLIENAEKLELKAKFRGKLKL